MWSRRNVGWVLVTGLAAFLAAQAQGPVTPRTKPLSPEIGKRPSSLRVDTRLVLVPVAVCDPMNHPVTGLEKEHFRVFDEKVEQTVTHFAMDDEPVAVGLLFDTSGSMGPKLRRARDAAAAFFATANLDDEFFLVEFADQPRLVVPLTRDTNEIQTQLTFAQSKGRTALLDALMLSLQEMQRSTKKRKALLIISDGGDNSSRYSETEVRNRVRESDVIVYAIGVFEGYGARSRTPEESAGPGLLNELAEQTGGRQFPADSFELPDIAAKIGIELRNRYVLGFSPTDQQRDGRYHKVKVQIITPKGLPQLKAYWRSGYYAPAE
jgi:Ca-activated chloride channel family protein